MHWGWRKLLKGTITVSVNEIQLANGEYRDLGAEARTLQFSIRKISG
jgi:hypothetical protein